ncbi:hypothetical protein AB851_17435 [Ralstonia pseudosolanacearum]|uniref:Transmembrane protein n=1 Tax=Ralstonia solanacearum TaxID=305 RepID=A0A0S4WD19_RALSL|nr:hypothetical protein AB851_17435 [Ralstonia pseudosolanacearum]CUV44238.1 conserved exported protein of unknown function [Ralstonia solanacearum]
MTRIRWLALAAWLLGVGAHLLIFTLLTRPTGDAEWYSSLAGIKVIVFLLTRLPLWIACLCMLALVECRIRGERD